MSPGPAGLPQWLSDLGRPLVMAVLNVTPDSFSDGGRWFTTDRAIDHGRRLVADGADLVDVGGESTRPGAQRVPEAEELRRILMVVTALADEGIPVSIDTMRAGVAEAAVGAGAVLVNDVSGGLADPSMAATVARLGCPYVATHWRWEHGRPAVDRGAGDEPAADRGAADELAADGRAGGERPRGYDPLAQVHSELSARLEVLTAAGVARERIAVDPGIGFGKDAAANWAVLRGLDQLSELGRPLVIGVSRKRFLGSLLADDSGPRPVDRRDVASAVLAGLLAAQGVWAVRAHDAAATRDAVITGAAWANGGPR